MATIICEGQDCTGKSLLISELGIHFYNVETVHFGFPQGNTIEEKLHWQKMDFIKQFQNSERIHTYGGNLLWDRSHIGEWTWAQKYRNYKPTWIWDLERLFDFDKRDDVYLILMYAEPEFLVKVDDGKSFSNKLEDKEHEFLLFQEAFQLSSIKNKLPLKVDDNGNYRNKNELLETVKNFIKMT